MSPEPSAPKECLTLYRDGSLGSTLIETIDAIITASRFPILSGAVPDHPISLTDIDSTGSEAADPIDLTGTTSKTTNTTASSSPTIGTDNSSSPCASSSTALTSPITSTDTFTSTNNSSSPPSSPPTAPTNAKPQPPTFKQQQYFSQALIQKLTTSLLTHFDCVIAQTLATHDEVVKKAPPIKMKGKLKQYRLVDDIWRLWVKDLEVVVGDVKERKPRANKKGGGKRKRDVDGDGDEDGKGNGDGEEGAGKRRRIDGGEVQVVDDGEGSGAIKVDKLLILACDGRGAGEEYWRRKTK